MDTKSDSVAVYYGFSNGALLMLRKLLQIAGYNPQSDNSVNEFYNAILDGKNINWQLRQNRIKELEEELESLKDAQK